MFWTIFDTSTKRDYYRDVHNLLALPPGTTIRYDYNEGLLSADAIAEAGKGDAAETKVLVAYAQDKNFKKGDAGPKGPIAYPEGLWIGTRIANLRHLRLSGNRWYFDLELGGYPANDAGAFDSIMRGLAAAQEIPFAKWVALSTQDASFQSLLNGAASDNWTSVINQLGSFPSQFAGDSFWRVAKIASGLQRRSLSPVLNPHTEVIDNREVTTSIEAEYPISQLDKLGIEIEARLPETGEESRDSEPEAARTLTCVTVADGPLKDLNGRILTLRRYSIEWIDAEVAASNRVDTQFCEAALTTGPAVGTYPIGPELLRLRFQVTKRYGFLALILAILAGACVAGASLIKDHVELTISLGVVAVLLVIVAGVLWTGKVQLPGAK
jgi:hypothetical protein